MMHPDPSERIRQCVHRQELRHQRHAWHEKDGLLAVYTSIAVSGSLVGEQRQEVRKILVARKKRIQTKTVAPQLQSAQVPVLARLLKSVVERDVILLSSLPLISGCMCLHMSEQYDSTSPAARSHGFLCSR